jgi:hypothetical protein
MTVLRDTGGASSGRVYCISNIYIRPIYFLYLVCIVVKI